MDEASRTGSARSPADPAETRRPTESTAQLRARLNFRDDQEWKRFSTRRLELINALRLDEKKPSKQEASVRAVATQLASEFGFPNSAHTDFERLVCLGIQSVRRNRRRPTKTGSLSTINVGVLSPNAARKAPQTAIASAIQGIETIASLGGMLPGMQAVQLLGSGCIRVAVGLALPHSDGQELLNSLETGALAAELSQILGLDWRHAIAAAASRNHYATIDSIRALVVELVSIAPHAQVAHVRALGLQMRPVLPPPRLWPSVTLVQDDRRMPYSLPANTQPSLDHLREHVARVWGYDVRLMIGNRELQQNDLADAFHTGATIKVERRQEALRPINLLNPYLPPPRSER